MKRAVKKAAKRRYEDTPPVPTRRVIDRRTREAVLGRQVAGEPPEPRGVGKTKTKGVRRGPRATEGEERAPRPTRSRHDGRHVRQITLPSGLPSVPQLWEEVQDMTDILLGRSAPPKEFGVLTLYEVADAYFGRASEITMLIQAGERSGSILKGSGHYRFRTGELRTFLEMAKRAADLGSRRLSAEQLEHERTMRGIESAT